MNKKIIQLVENFSAGEKKEAEELLKTLGIIPAPSRLEDQRAQFVYDWFKEHGAKDLYIDEMKNVVFEYGLEDYEDIVVFMAHTDIVFPDLDPLLMREEGRKLYAPGIGDDTANLVNLMMAARYLIKNKVEPKCGLLIVANSCKEGLGNLDGCKEIFKNYGDRIKAFYSFDGSVLSIANGAVGYYRYRVTLKTQGGHSYGDFGRENAIASLSQIINKLYDIQLPEGEKTTFNVGSIEGGTTVNSIAQSASMLYEFRSPSQQNLKYMEEKFKSIIESFEGDGREIIVEILGIRPGNGDLDEEEQRKFTEKSADIVNTFVEGDIEIGASSTDANIPLSKGIIANTIGTIR